MIAGLEESYYGAAEPGCNRANQEEAIDDFMTAYLPSGLNPCVEELNALGIFPKRIA
jgi:hypothetical protein